MQDIWRDCIEPWPQEKLVAFNTSNKYFLNYEMCIDGWFSKIKSHFGTAHCIILRVIMIIRIPVCLLACPLTCLPV